MSLLPTTAPSASSAIPLKDFDSTSPSTSSTPPPSHPLHTNSLSSSITSTYSRLSPDDAARRLATSLTHGLTPLEADVRLLRHGPNELPHDAPDPLWLRFLGQFKEPLILLLLASAAISFFLGNFDDAISITLAVLIVVTVGFVQEYRSEKSLEALNRLVPHYAHLVRGDTNLDAPNASGSAPADPAATANPTDFHDASTKAQSTTVLAQRLVPGDLVLFSAGDRIPADIRITKCADLSIDESNLTGENEPVYKYSHTLEREDDARPFYDGAPERNLRLSEQHNVAFMGTLVRSGYGQGLVIATGPRTEFGSIHASLQDIESPRTPLQLSMDRLGQELSYMSFIVIGLIVIIGLLQGRKLLDMFTIGVSLAVAAIPEGLPIIVTVTLALGVLRMTKHGAIVRRLPSVETLGSVSVVCSDKTGTLTLNHMTVTKMWHFDAPHGPFDVKDSSSSTLVSNPATRSILRTGNLANNARLSSLHASATPGATTASAAAILNSTEHQSTGTIRSRWAGQPTDVAILDLLDVYGEDDLRDRIPVRVAETPFSSERKWMGVVVGSAGTPESSSTGSNGSGSSNGTGTGNGSGAEVAYVKGSIEEVLKRCDTYLTPTGKEALLDETKRTAAKKAADDMARDGLRVIAFASGSVRDSSSALNRGPTSRVSTPDKYGRATPPAQTAAGKKEESNERYYNGLVFSGLVGMSDPPRKDVHKSIRQLMAGGVKVIMITGDAEQTATAIGAKLGMPINYASSASTSHAGNKAVLRGDEIEHMSTTELAQRIAGTSIFARTSPEHKMKIVRALQSRGDVVAMTGDGVNDAPALKKADIGISMGRLGTDVAKEASDMILTDDDFSTILRAIEQGKSIFYNIQNFITFQLSTSVAALSLVLVSTTCGYKNPLNAMQILWINVLMDGPPAQSLGVEPADHSIMNRPPRPKNARVLTRTLLRRVLVQASFIMLGTLLIYIREMSDESDGASGTHSYVVTPRDTTMTFTCFVLFDMFNALSCRSESKSVVGGELKVFGNKMFNYAVAGSLIGQACVVYMPLLQGIFQTEGIGLGDWVGLLCVASSVFWVDEGRKYWRGRKGWGRRGPLFRGYSSNV